MDYLEFGCQESALTLSGRPALCGGRLSAPPWQPLIEASVAVAKGWDVVEQTILEGRLLVPTRLGRLSEQPKCMQASGSRSTRNQQLVHPGLTEDRTRAGLWDPSGPAPSPSWLSLIDRSRQPPASPSPPSQYRISRCEVLHHFHEKGSGL